MKRGNRQTLKHIIQYTIFKIKTDCKGNAAIKKRTQIAKGFYKKLSPVKRGRNTSINIKLRALKAMSGQCSYMDVDDGLKLML